MLDLVILTLGLMIHMWALPYSFKNQLIDSIVRVVQLGFGLVILVFLDPSRLVPSPTGLVVGIGVGIACLGFQLLWHRGAKLRREDITRRFVASQALILLFHVPTEEIFYRGVFFTYIATIWGPFTAIVFSAALSTMVTVVGTRRQIYWLGSALMGLLCCMGYYWSQCIWAPVLIHVLNDVGFDTLNERRNLFDS
ncbi:MAG TPA: CPBP family intramembrane glutamic endopeptidase [Spirochaetia bacterium]